MVFDHGDDPSSAWSPAERRLGLVFPPFEPHPFLPGPAAQTFFGVLPRAGEARYREQGESRVLRVDGTTSVRVELDRPDSNAASGPLRGMVVLHGLVGSSEAPYSIGLARKARAAGFLVARLNARNCGETEELTRAPYNGADTEDVAAAAEGLLEEGAASVHLVGFSVGANQVARLLAAWGEGAPPWIAGASLVSPCLDFAVAADTIGTTRLGRLAEWRFLRRLKRIVKRRAELGPELIDLSELDAVRTIRDFDERYTGPLSGDAGADAYYDRARMSQRLGEIRVPTLVVAARDDPMVPFDSIGPLRENPALLPLVTERGGHVAFFGRRPARAGGELDRDRYWAENRVVQFARACAGP